MTRVRFRRASSGHWVWAGGCTLVLVGDDAGAPGSSRHEGYATAPNGVWIAGPPRGWWSGPRDLGGQVPLKMEGPPGISCWLHGWG